MQPRLVIRILRQIIKTHNLMIKNYLILSFLVLSILTFGNDSKIKFRDVANFDEAIELSKKENKLSMDQ